MKDEVIKEKGLQQEHQDVATTDAIEDSSAAGISQDVIDKATKMGWTEKSQFKGDPAKWRPADEFVERGTK